MTGTSGFGELRPTPASPRRIGRYEVLGEIARGGMGVVYKAMEPGLGRLVAIKVMLSMSDPIRRERFRREAEALAKVQHPNVVRIHSYDLTASLEPYMVMEFVEGETLQTELDLKGPLDCGEAVRVVTTLCSAVASCHAAGVLHRDLKPDNVLVSRDGVLKLTDFGLIRDMDPSTSRTRLSRDGAAMGTPGYWAPEQALGELGSIGERTDVYGLGATLFALLTGRPPHLMTSLAELVAAMETEAPAPSSLNPAVPRWLDRAVGRALAADPARRYPSAQELANALNRVASGIRWRLALLPLLALLVVGVVALRVIRAEPAVSSMPEQPAPETSTSQSPLDRAAFNRGVTLTHEGRWEEALEAFGEAIRIEPEFASTYNNRGACREVLGDLAGAIEDYTESLRLEPASSSYGNRAAARQKQRDFQGAVEDFTEAIRLRPDHAETYVDRGAAKQPLDDWQGAIDDYDRAIELDPTLCRAYANRASSKTVLGDLSGAIEDYERALQIDPNVGWASEMREEMEAVRRRLEGRPGALEDLDRTLELDPKHTKARELQETLEENRHENRPR